jgi:hypothetical protein
VLIPREPRERVSLLWKVSQDQLVVSSTFLIHVVSLSEECKVMEECLCEVKTSKSDSFVFLCEVCLNYHVSEKT